MAWDAVPTGYTHGIVTGYTVLYSKSADHFRNPRSFTTTGLHIQLNSLEKYTLYLIRVLAFTIKGNGTSSNNVTVSTAEDGKVKYSKVK